MKFRPHRGGLAESMAEVREVSSILELQTLCAELACRPLPHPVIVEPYCGPDPRSGWPITYIVIAPGLGVMGYTDGPISALEHFGTAPTTQRST